MMTMKLKTFFIASTVLLFGGCVALVAVSGDTGNAPSGQSASVEKATEDVPLATMASVRADRSVQIDRLELVDSLPTGNPYIKPVEADSGKLAVVYLQAKNTGKESGDLMFTTFELVDSADRKYSEIQDFEDIVSLNAWAETQGLDSSDKQLFPGETASVVKVFRIAPDAAELLLVGNSKTFKTN